MQTPGIVDVLLSAYPAMPPEVAQRAEGIVQAYHGLERELTILADEITTRTANHVPVAADELERWLMRSKNINERQLRACEELNELGRSLDERWSASCWSRVCPEQQLKAKSAGPAP